MKRLIREKNFGEKIFEIFFTKAQTTTLGSCQEFKLIVLEANIMYDEVFRYQNKITFNRVCAILGSKQLHVYRKWS